MLITLRISPFLQAFFKLLKDRQHRSRDGSDFPFITQEPKGVAHRVIYQMKGNICFYPMILSNKGPMRIRKH